ncbi:MAG: ATP-dependent zinc metalloprotease FtsH, partial [Butyricicoccus sp.]
MKKGKMKGFAVYLIILVGMLAAVSYMLTLSEPAQELVYSDVIQLIEQEKVEEMLYKDGVLNLKLKDGTNQQIDMPYYSILHADLGDEIKDQVERGVISY